MPGGGEHGFVGPQHSGVTDLRTCTDQWCVECWLQLGGHVQDVYGRSYTFAHVCGSYDNSEVGVWELALSQPEPGDDGPAACLGLAPTVTFASSTHVWEVRCPGLQPWTVALPVSCLLSGVSVWRPGERRAWGLGHARRGCGGRSQRRVSRTRMRSGTMSPGSIPTYRRATNCGWTADACGKQPGQTAYD
jgi:hypothetical protein